MKYERIDMGAYNVHLINTDKFKTTTISFNFRENVKKEEITIRKFLFQMLCFSNLEFNTNRLLQIKLEDLYSSSLSYSNVKFGNIINSYIDIKFLNDKYSETGMLKECLNFALDILFKPNVEDGKFDTKSFNIIKNKLKLSINSLGENPQKYSLIRSLEEMDKNDPASYSLWGNPEDLDNVTEKSLYKYYQKVLKTNKIDIFVVGTFDKQEILNILSEKFSVNTIKMDTTEPYIIYDKCPKTKEVEEEMNDLQQSKLSIVCKILNITEFERRYVLPIYASILGGSSNSRLFMNVREKESLAYSIHAMTKGPNSLLMISGGINTDNYNKAIKIIKRELRSMKKDITDEEINISRSEIISSIETMLDNPGSIINYFFGIEVFNSDKLEDKINNFNKVTKKDIEQISNKIKIAIIYLLKGKAYEKE